jgi:hypothetical protein
MSTEAVFIVYIIADIETNKGTTSLEVTDLEKGSSEDNDSGNAIENDIHKNPIEMLADNTRQGPLASGGYLHIGSFDDLIPPYSPG